jgi:serine O-acetyltransferase
MGLASSASTAGHVAEGPRDTRLGIEVHPASTIGAGFALVHGVGVVIGAEVTAGSNLVVYQGVTLGHGADVSRGQPRIGDNVRIGAGAKVLGPCAIGDGARIGANAVVLSDVPPGRTVVGVWK